MKVLVVGGGGREHAICWKLAQSEKVDKIFCAPGNAGIAKVAECVAVGAEDIDGICGFAKENDIDLAVIGPEVPLAMGIVDELEAAGVKTFGPNKKCSWKPANPLPRTSWQDTRSRRRDIKNSPTNRNCWMRWASSVIRWC